MTTLTPTQRRAEAALRVAEIAAYAERNSETARIRNLPVASGDVPDFTPVTLRVLNAFQHHEHLTGNQIVSRLSGQVPLVDVYKALEEMHGSAWRVRRTGVPEMWARTDDRPILMLRPVQNHALYTLQQTGGLVGLIGVGHGKTLLILMACGILKIKPSKTLVLLEPNLIDTFWREAWKWKAEGYPVLVPNVMSYAMLSRPDGEQVLIDMAPELIALDEAHNVRNRGSARSKRLFRFIRKARRGDYSKHVMALSGTLIRNGIADLANLAEHTLGALSPLPRASVEYNTLEAWCRVFDMFDTNTGEGPTDNDKWVVARACGGSDSEHLLARIKSAPGVVATTSSACDASMYFQTYEPKTPMPKAIEDALKGVEDAWVLPEGEEITDAIGRWRAFRQIASGFYYRWAWPNGVVDHEWLYHRAAWHKALRGYLKFAVSKRDTPGLVRRALEGGWRAPDELAEMWAAWGTVKGRPQPPTETIWLDGADWALNGALASAPALKSECRLVWYESRAVAGWAKDNAPEDHVVILPGQDPPVTIPRGKTHVWLSVASHGTGMNLQAFREQIILYPLSHGATAQQLLGRCHRPGQLADAVWTYIGLPTQHAKDALKRCKETSKWLEATTGEPQKMRLGTWV